MRDCARYCRMVWHSGGSCIIVLNGAEWCELLISKFKLSDRSIVVPLLICGTVNPPPFTFQHHFEPIYHTIWHYCAWSNTIQHYSSPFSTLPIQFHYASFRTITTRSSTIPHFFIIPAPTHTIPHYRATCGTMLHYFAPTNDIPQHSGQFCTILYHSAPPCTNRRHPTSIRHHHSPFSTIMKDSALCSTTKHHRAHSRAITHYPTPLSTIQLHSAPSSTILPHHAPFRSCIIPSIYLLSIHTSRILQTYLPINKRTDHLTQLPTN